jgi:oligoendopeptidase F
MAKNRNEIPEKLTWDLTTIYKTDKEWEAELTRIKSELSLVEETDPGHLLDSAERRTSGSLPQPHHFHARITRNDGYHQ